MFVYNKIEQNRVSMVFISYTEYGLTVSNLEPYIGMIVSHVNGVL